MDNWSLYKVENSLWSWYGNRDWYLNPFFSLNLLTGESFCFATNSFALWDSNKSDLFFALMTGSFWIWNQIYSRTPNPGPAFIERCKSYLANYGYDPTTIKDTPQDCEVMSDSQLALMMSQSGMQQALTNQFPDLGLKAPVEFNPFTSIFDTLRKLVALYFK